MNRAQNTDALVTALREEIAGLSNRLAAAESANARPRTPAQARVDVEAVSRLQAALRDRERAAQEEKAAWEAKLRNTREAMAGAVGLYKLNADDPQFESVWFQPLQL